MLEDIFLLNVNNDIMRSYFIDLEQTADAPMRFLRQIDNPMVPNYSVLDLDMRTVDLKMAPDTDPLNIVEKNITKSYMVHENPTNTRRAKYFFVDFRSRNSLSKV